MASQRISGEALPGVLSPIIIPSSALKSVSDGVNSLDLLDDNSISKMSEEYGHNNNMMKGEKEESILRRQEEEEEVERNEEVGRLQRVASLRKQRSEIEDWYRQRKMSPDRVHVHPSVNGNKYTMNQTKDNGTGQDHDRKNIDKEMDNGHDNDIKK